MPERTSYAEGTPSWVDLASPDVDASTAFYGALFGWTADGATETPEDSGRYEIFALRGKRVAGVMPIMDPEQPPAWSTYIAVDDLNAVAAKATQAGGQVVVEPMDVMDAGRMAFFVDPSGAYIGAWQAGQHIGAELVNEPGAVGWNELTTRDPAAVKGFYAAVFGMEAAPWAGPEGGRDYTVWNVDGEMVGGLLPMDGNWPPEVPSHWATYFIVEDADATTAQTTELGGSVRVPPFDAPGIGRMAVLADPHGAGFSIIAGPDAADG